MWTLVLTPSKRSLPLVCCTAINGGTCARPKLQKVVRVDWSNNWLCLRILQRSVMLSLLWTDWTATFTKMAIHCIPQWRADWRHGDKETLATNCGRRQLSHFFGRLRCIGRERFEYLDDSGRVLGQSL